MASAQIWRPAKTKIAATRMAFVMPALSANMKAATKGKQNAARNRIDKPATDKLYGAILAYL